MDVRRVAADEWRASRSPDDLAIECWNFLSNGMGGVDWSGFDLFCAYRGVDDIEGLIDRLIVIRSHDPSKDKE